MTPRFFIDRPIFATVLSVLVTLAGGLAVFTLPVSQYPQVTPPTIQIDCNYPGASSDVVAQTIAAPIEQQVNGVEEMLYMSSQCTSDGSYTLTVTFKIGTDLNMAQVRVLNRVALAYPQLPDVVRATGVTTRKRSPELLLTVSLNSPAEPGHPRGRYDQLYLSNYAVLRLKEELSRLPGISDVTIFGQRDYAMRIWVDPEKLSARGLTANDVVQALRDQNAQVAAGQVGQPPVGPGQPHQITLSAVGRLTTVEEFENVVVKVGPQAQVVRLRDVARVELGAKLQDVSNSFDNKSTIGLAIFLLPDANSLEVADVIKEKMAETARDFPTGMRYEIGYDTTPFVRESIGEVYRSLQVSIVLVGIVVLVFLQSWRAAIIPLAAVPVAIIGTFAAMAAVGFSLNNLTLFGLVLAVGIVVDDAIVVVEAVQHQLEKGLAPREATVRAMEEVAGPVIAVGVVLSAVFIPCAFLSGIVGQFFRQFALTIAVSTAISTFNSLTLSPALCALLLRPKGPDTDRRPFPRGVFLAVGAVIGGLLASGYRILSVRLTVPDAWAEPFGAAAWWAVPAITGAVGGAVGLAAAPLINRALALFFRVFNWAFRLNGRVYVRTVGFLLRAPAVALAVYAGLVLAGVWGYRTLPTGFIPQQDKGYLMASIQLPDAASAERTREAIRKITATALSTPGVHHCNAVAGNSFVLSAYGSNFGSMFIILDGFDKRRAPELYADQIAARLRQRFAEAVPEAQVNVFGAPAVSGLGRAGGFRIMIEDRTDVGPLTLQRETDNFIRKANEYPQVVGLFTVYKARAPQVYLDVDRVACQSRGVELADVYGTLQATMGSRYVNDFNRFGRTWQVNVQADQTFRNHVEDIAKLKIRNRHGDMVPLAAVVSVREHSAPQVISRYNMYPAAAVNGNVAQGTSTGDAIALLEKLADDELPHGRMAYEWSELTFIEKASRGSGAYIFAISVAFVFLVLAALYESWAFPLAVILVVPVCVACSLAAVWVTDPGSAAVSAADLLRWAGAPPDSDFGQWLVGAGRWADANPARQANALLSAAGVRKQDVNIFTQVGFVVLIGLACKNAILIVEFAKVARDKGADLRTAVLDACQLRYRPILMTSMAFILGVAPLAVATGAGAEMRQALGVAVIGGMIGVTMFGVFLTPVFFALVDRVTNSSFARNPYVRAVSDALLYVLSFRYVRPVGRQLVAVAGAGVRKVTRRRP
jgi:multidrug efflux pump